MWDGETLNLVKVPEHASRLGGMSRPLDLLDKA